MSSKIAVQGDRGAVTYEGADGWTVDDRGDLHIITKGSGHRTVATHAHGHWSTVVRIEVQGE